MSTTLGTAAAGFAAVNLAFLGTLSAIWIQNYRTFRTPLVLGLLAFSVVLFVENAVALYAFLTMSALYAMDPAAQQIVAGLRGLQFLALLFLTYATVRN